MKILNKSKRSLGLPGVVALVLEPNVPTPVTSAQVDEFCQNVTVQRWFERGMLELLDDEGEPVAAEQQDPAGNAAGEDAAAGDTNGEQDDTLDIPDHVPEHGVYVDHLGGGWYYVWVNGIKVTDEKVQGKAAAQEIAEEYENPED